MATGGPHGQGAPAPRGMCVIGDDDGRCPERLGRPARLGGRRASGAHQGRRAERRSPTVRGSSGSRTTRLYSRYTAPAADAATTSATPASTMAEAEPTAATARSRAAATAAAGGDPGSDIAPPPT